MRSAALVALCATVVATTGAGIAGQTTPKPIWARNAPLPEGFNPGEPFPAIFLPSALDGHPASIAEFRGRKLIVSIFASW